MADSRCWAPPTSTFFLPLTLVAAWTTTSWPATASARPEPVFRSAAWTVTPSGAGDDASRDVIATVWPLASSRGTSSFPSPPVPPVTSTLLMAAQPTGQTLGDGRPGAGRAEPPHRALVRQAGPAALH